MAHDLVGWSGDHAGLLGGAGAAGPLIAASAGLPATHADLWTGLASSAAAVGRAVVVLGLFAAVGTAAVSSGADSWRRRR
jgi:hypothetical protein